MKKVNVVRNGVKPDITQKNAFNKVLRKSLYHLVQCKASLDQSLIGDDPLVFFL